VLAFACLLGVTARPAAADAPDLVRNGSFAQARPDGIAAEWTCSGPLFRACIEPGVDPTGGKCQRLEIAGKRVLEFSQDVAVPPGKILLFRARVKAADSVTVTLGGRRMSYSTPDEWQTMADLVRPGQAETLKIVFRLGGLHNQHNIFRISNVELREADAPPPRRRKTYGPTTLVRAGEPQAVIVHPETSPSDRDLAVRIQAAVRDRCGATLPVASHLAVTAADAPVIKPEYRDRHLILLGRLGVNRAIWPAYNRFLCAADGYYPGGDGHVVRTAANVLHNGRNHIILGGSSDAGVGKAVERFVSIVNETPAGGDRSLELPWLLDVELGGACLTALREDDARWTEDPASAGPSKLEPGYGKVVRWYMNAMAWYWTGWPSYRARTLEYLQPVLEDRAHTHHYIIEFLVHTYDMLDDSGLLTPEQVAATDALLLDNFRGFLTGPDLGWMTLFNRPYDNIALTNRHSIAPWMADLTMADFLHDYFDLTGRLADIVAYRHAEKHAVLRHMVNERWQPSLPRTVGPSHHEEIVASFFRYALRNECYEFFRTGAARRALWIDRMHPSRTASMDDHLLMGILAHYYRDGRYLSLLRGTPPPARLFQNRYVCGVRRYVPGPELEPEDPTSLGGVRTAQLQPHDEKTWRNCTFSTHLSPAGDPQEAIEAVTFRSGFGPEDDYLLVNGFGTHNGAIAQFYSGGQMLLMISNRSTFGPGSGSYYDLNAVCVLRTDRWIDAAKPYAGAARRNWVANLRRSGGASLTIEPFMTAAWRREIVWIEPGLYVVRDVVTALEDGEYAVRIGWRPQGTPAWDGAVWTASLAGIRFRLTPLGAGFHVLQNVPRFLEGVEPRPRFHHAADAALEAGESLTATMVLHAARSDEPTCAAQLTGPDRLVLTPSGPGRDPVVVIWGPASGGRLESDAKVLVLRPQRVVAMSATRCVIGGRSVIRSEKPISASVDWKAGTIVLDEGDAGLRVVSMPEGAEDAVGRVAPAAADAAPAGTPGPTAASAAAPEAQALTAVDESASWRETWRYDGLLRPARLRQSHHAAEDIVDLGRDVHLAEIRAIRVGPRWTPSRLPDDLRTALPGPDGHLPAPESDAWRPLTEAPVWRAGIRTGNYGQAVPKEQGYQIVSPKELRARFIRSAGLATLVYYDADAREARTPLRLELGDMNGDGKPEILAAPDLWPPFIRTRTDEDTILAVLDAGGKELFQHHSEQNMQQVRLLEPDASGRAHVFVLSQDARVRVLAHDGTERADIDLYAMHEHFNATKGKPNTRHPAGGFAMPYSLGLWRPDADGKRKMIVSRYGAHSFLNAESEFEGVLMSGGYVLCLLLPYGVDFNGNGKDEQLCLAKFGLQHLDGDAVPHIPDPGGTLFYPQVYSAAGVIQPGRHGRLVDGERPLLFAALPFKAAPVRYVAVVRESYVALYDGLERKWAFTWTPVVPIHAATIAHASEDALVIVVRTAGDLLWKLVWKESADQLASFEVKSCTQSIRRMSAAPGAADAVVIASGDGLHLLRNFSDLKRLAAGSYQDARIMPGNPNALVAVTARGEVLRLDRQPE